MVTAAEQSDFVRRMYPYALAWSAKTGIPPQASCCGLVGATFEQSLRQVAIPAEQLQIVTFSFAKDLTTQTQSKNGAALFPFTPPVIVDVIEGQKLWLRLAAASALAAIQGQCGTSPLSIVLVFQIAYEFGVIALPLRYPLTAEFTRQPLACCGATTAKGTDTPCSPSLTLSWQSRGNRGTVFSVAGFAARFFWNSWLLTTVGTQASCFASAVFRLSCHSVYPNSCQYIHILIGGTEYCKKEVA